MQRPHFRCPPYSPYQSIIHIEPYNRLCTSTATNPTWSFIQSFGDDGSSPDDFITTLCFDPTGNFIAVGDRAGRLCLFEAHTGGGITYRSLVSDITSSQSTDLNLPHQVFVPSTRKKPAFAAANAAAAVAAATAATAATAAAAAASTNSLNSLHNNDTSPSLNSNTNPDVDHVNSTSNLQSPSSSIPSSSSSSISPLTSAATPAPTQDTSPYTSGQIAQPTDANLLTSSTGQKLWTSQCLYPSMNNPLHSQFSPPSWTEDVYCPEQLTTYSNYIRQRTSYGLGAQTLGCQTTIGTSLQNYTTRSSTPMATTIGRTSDERYSIPSSATASSNSSEWSTTPENLEYLFFTEFQSHADSFDCLKSSNIPPTINVATWIQSTPLTQRLLAANDKTIHLWSIFDRQVKSVLPESIYEQQQQQPQQSSSNDLGHPNFNGNIPTLHNNRLASDLVGDDDGNEDSINFAVYNPVKHTHGVYVIPPCAPVASTTLASRRGVFNHGHSYNINSLSPTCSGDGFVSSDDLIALLWNYEYPMEPFTLIDLRPSQLDDVTETITSSKMHPCSDSLLLYSTSRGAVRLCDIRINAHVEHVSARSFQLEDNPLMKNFFTELLSSVSDAKFTPSGQYIISRDYMNVYLWDLRNESRPISTVKVNESLQKHTVELYESDSIFDNFHLASSPDGLQVITGSYDNSFIIHNWSDRTTQYLQAGLKHSRHVTKPAARRVNKQVKTGPGGGSTGSPYNNVPLHDASQNVNNTPLSPDLQASSSDSSFMSTKQQQQQQQQQQQTGQYQYYHVDAKTSVCFTEPCRIPSTLALMDEPQTNGKTNAGYDLQRNSQINNGNTQQTVQNLGLNHWLRRALHVAWHPVLDCVAVTGVNKLYVYQSLHQTDETER